MGSLRELLLDVNQFEGPLPDVWASLPNLQRIFLSENQLTGPLPEAWSDLMGLTDLWVEYNKVRSNGRQHLYASGHHSSTFYASTRHQAALSPPQGLRAAAAAVQLLCR